MQLFILSSVQQLGTTKFIKLTENKDQNSILAPFEVRAKTNYNGSLFYLFSYPCNEFCIASYKIG